MTDNIEQPPNKKLRSEQEFIRLIEDCYKMHFNSTNKTQEEEEQLQAGLKKIQDILEQAQSSRDVSFGQSRSSTKITWGKCLSLMLETKPHNLLALKNLSGPLSPGGGLI